jgi:molybdopterin-guanine dinucleotide biosynthesis protein B
MKNAMRTVAIVGFSETGKTRLIVQLVRELKGRGLRVAAVKRCSHGFTLDIEGKDTSDFSEAGADGVAMISPEGWAALGKAPDVEASRLASRLFPDADVVLVEGGKDAPRTRKIEVLRAGVSGALMSRPGELVAVVSDMPLPGDSTVPVFAPENVPGIADFILSLEEENMTEIRLEVDGREVNMNPFVRTFIENTVLGMVTSLSGLDPDPKKISLVIDRTAGKAAPGGKP